MTRGGARNRSGPPADPNSGRSEARGFKLTALPSEGYSGPIPDWPAPHPRPRDLAWWEWAWRTPQACAWSMPSERWRIPFVAEWCELKADLEEGRTASLMAQKFRADDRIGFSTAGLAEMGWKVAEDEVAAVRRANTEAFEAEAAAPPVRRLRAAP